MFIRFYNLTNRYVLYNVINLLFVHYLFSNLNKESFSYQSSVITVYLILLLNRKIAPVKYVIKLIENVNYIKIYSEIAIDLKKEFINLYFLDFQKCEYTFRFPFFSLIVMYKMKKKSN